MFLISPTSLLTISNTPAEFPNLNTAELFPAPTEFPTLILACPLSETTSTREPDVFLI